CCLSLCFLVHPGLPSFPTRRSSDLGAQRQLRVPHRQRPHRAVSHQLETGTGCAMYGTSEVSLSSAVLQTAGENHGRNDREQPGLDRKSTRLNSSHVSISYAVFCLKK